MLLQISLITLKFRPVFKLTIWGGNRIASFMDREECAESMALLQEGKIGECWGVSAVEGYESVVINGDD